MAIPKSRAEAIKKGASRYFTGKPCKHGHISERQSISGNCIECFKTVYLDMVRDHDRKRMQSKIEVRNSINTDTRKTASRNGEEWTQTDVDLATMKRPDGGYVYTISELVIMLGRSMRSIERGRHRYRNHKEVCNDAI